MNFKNFTSKRQVKSMERHEQVLLDFAKEYCRKNSLSAEKIEKQDYGWGSGPRGDLLTFSVPNPNAQPERGLYDDENLPFCTLIVRCKKDENGVLRFSAEETPYTKKFL